jgi:hypothetical protein
MSISATILFLDSAVLGQPDSLENILKCFEDVGFEINELQVEGSRFDRNDYLGDSNEITALAYGSQALSFSAKHLVWSMEVFQQVVWGEHKMGERDRAYIRTTTDNIGLWRSGYDNERLSSYFLELGRKLYMIVKPSFGWIDQYHGWTTTHEDIESLSLRLLYWANFFGPKFVQKLGRDKIMNAPAWKVEELIDGGILYLLGPHLGLTDQHVPIERVKTYFDIK